MIKAKQDKQIQDYKYKVKKILFYETIKDEKGNIIDERMQILLTEVDDIDGFSVYLPKSELDKLKDTNGNFDAVKCKQTFQKFVDERKKALLANQSNSQKQEITLSEDIII